MLNWVLVDLFVWCSVDYRSFKFCDFRGRRVIRLVLDQTRGVGGGWGKNAIFDIQK